MTTQLLQRSLLKKLLLICLLVAVTQSKAQVKPSSSGLAPVNGIRIYYEVYGTGAPIVLLHGAFFSIDMNWAQLIPELSRTHKVIALEMQGHGHTPYFERPMSITNFAKDVDGLMDYLKVDSADIVGFSMGGSVAYQFAVTYPKRVKKLVIISSTYKDAGWIPQVNDAFKGITVQFFTDSPLKPAYDAVAPDKTKWTKFVESMIAFAGEKFDVGDSNIAKITAPVLLISGDNDGLDKVELAKTYQLLGGGGSADMGAVSRSQLAIVPAQGHVSLMMDTPVILGYLNGFLK